MLFKSRCPLYLCLAPGVVLVDWSIGRRHWPCRVRPWLSDMAWRACDPCQWSIPRRGHPSRGNFKRFVPGCKRGIYLVAVYNPGNSLKGIGNTKSVMNTLEAMETEQLRRKDSEKHKPPSIPRWSSQNAHERLLDQ